MVVRLDEGPAAGRVYVAVQAANGRDHVVDLVRQARDDIAAASEGLSEAEANFQPGPDEFSISQVLQHLNLSMARSVDRIRSLSAGAESTYSGPPGRPGGLPEEPAGSCADLRKHFVDGTNAV